MAYNKLTDAEDERLAMLGEEGGEIAQVLGKINRHGYESVHPHDERPVPETNRRALEREIGDLMGVLDVMIAEGDLDVMQISDARAKKVSSIRLGRWTHHQ